MRYFFTVRAEGETIPDLVGVDLPHTDAARQYAAAQVIELWEARLLAGKAPYVGWLEVTDDQQRGVFQIPL